MHIVIVHVHVIPDCIEEFRKATIENASNSLKEPGVVRFDVLQRQDDPTWFVLNEVYRTPDDQGRHKETAHYSKWRDAVADMMAEPRQGIKFSNIFPEDDEWGC